MTGFPQQVVLLQAWRKPGRLSTDILCKCLKPVPQCFSLFEMTPLMHGALLPFEGAGAQLAFSSPIDTESRAVMQDNDRNIGELLSGTGLRVTKSDPLDK
ncbi:hypothetical protein CQ12_23960 [Bradyrhizobium jicamae]|uniref:Uncharacterized protein n=1 Tax=Bradyrhizobium jicamae TaxID=280332 RepID=A0A0R3L1F8_9BRAD|nr:hypothetical protein CQ12_23960 [Bradyrhizobium jicamae]